MQQAGIVGVLCFSLLSALGVGCGSDDVSTTPMGTGGTEGGSAGNPQGGSAGNPQGGSAGNPQGGSAGNPQGGSAGNPQGGSAGNPQGGSAGNPQGGSAGNAGSSLGGCVNAQEPDYASLCTGNTFFPDDSCADGVCATTEFEKKVYAAWRSRAIEVSGLSEPDFLDRVKISGIEQMDGPVYVFVRIEMVIKLGWIRLREAVSVNLGEYPLQTTPTDAQITSATDLGMGVPHSPLWKGLGAVKSIVCPDQVQTALSQCQASMDLHWCDIRFQNGTNKLTVGAYGVVDFNANECKEAEVELTTAALLTCMDSPCAIN